jgi:hypothetical protein
MGMLNAAVHIRREIDNLGILSQLMRQEHHASKPTVSLTTPLVSV